MRRCGQALAIVGLVSHGSAFGRRAGPILRLPNTRAAGLATATLLTQIMSIRQPTGASALLG